MAPGERDLLCSPSNWDCRLCRNSASVCIIELRTGSRALDGRRSALCGVERERSWLSLSSTSRNSAHPIRDPIKALRLALARRRLLANHLVADAHLQLLALPQAVLQYSRNKLDHGELREPFGDKLLTYRSVDTFAYCADDLGGRRLEMERYTQAALCIALAVAVKPLAIVLALLMFAISAPMRLRLVLAAITLVLCPFLCQSPGYVMQQYSECLTMLRTAADLGNSGEWAQLFGMLDFFGVPTSGRLQNVVRMVAALATLVLAFRTLRLESVEKQAMWLFTWTVVYLLLFNPRTENSTYCLLGR